MSYLDTQRLMNLVIRTPVESVQSELHAALTKNGFNAGQFYTGIAEHGPGMKLKPIEWSALLKRLPNRILHSQLDLEKLLTEEQLLELKMLMEE